MYNFSGQDRINEIRSKTAPNERELGVIEISSDGTKISHGLRKIPKWVDCIPLSNISWYYYQKPDATYVYIKASETGKFIVTVGG